MSSADRGKALFWARIAAAPGNRPDNDVIAEIAISPSGDLKNVCRRYI